MARPKGPETVVVSSRVPRWVADYIADRAEQTGRSVSVYLADNLTSTAERAGAPGAPPAKARSEVAYSDPTGKTGPKPREVEPRMKGAKS